MTRTNRSRKDWADTTARGVLSGSFAQSQNVLIMALEDLATLFAENARLTAQLAEREAECFKLAAGVCEYRSGDDHGNPLCLMVRRNIPSNMYPVTVLKERDNG
jgi:hypothetical protein